MEQNFAHFLDLVDLVLRIDPGSGESVTHAWRLADAIRDTIKEAQLRWEVVLLVRDLDLEERLTKISELSVIDLLEILSNFSLLVIETECRVDGVLLEVNVIDNVGPLVSPVSDDTLVDKLKFDYLLELVLAVRLLLDLIDSLEASLGGHELKDIVDGKGASKFTLESRSFEARPNLDILQVNRVAHIKEAW